MIRPVTVSACVLSLFSVRLDYDQRGYTQVGHSSILSVSPIYISIFVSVYPSNLSNYLFYSIYLFYYYFFLEILPSYLLVLYLSDDICPGGSMSNTTMCPICDNFCKPWQLGDTCLLSKVSPGSLWILVYCQR